MKATLNPASLQSVWIEAQEDAVRAVADATSPQDKARVLQLLGKVKSSGDRRSRDLKRIVVAATNMAMSLQERRWQQAQSVSGFETNHALNNSKADFERDRRLRDPAGMKRALNNMAASLNANF